MEQNLAKPKQAAALRSLVTFKFDSAFICDVSARANLSSCCHRDPSGSSSQDCVLFQNLSLDFTRVFHETSCERSQVQTQKTSATVNQPSTIQCCLKQCLRLETNTSSLLLTLSSFQSLKHQQTRPQPDHPPRQDRRDLQLHQGGH